MSSLDFIYDIRDEFKRRKKDSFILSLQLGKKNTLKNDLIVTIQDECSMHILMQTLPEIAQNLTINKNYKMCPKSLEHLCKGMAKQNNYYLILMFKHNQKSCGFDMFYYLPNQDLVAVTRAVLHEFYHTVLGQKKPSGEESGAAPA